MRRRKKKAFRDHSTLKQSSIRSIRETSQIRVYIARLNVEHIKSRSECLGCVNVKAGLSNLDQRILSNVQDD